MAILEETTIFNTCLTVADSIANKNQTGRGDNFHYDDNGNLIDDDAYTYYYDYENRLGRSVRPLPIGKPKKNQKERIKNR